MTTTTFADDDGFDWDEYLGWLADDEDFEEYDDDYAPDLADQLEYMLDHRDDG